jgi:acetyl-CoA carboxylase carboxyltransferase component
MCGKAFDPRFIFAWPTAKIAVMGGAQAAKTLLQIQKANIEKKKGDVLTPEEEQALLDDITARYDKSTTAYYAAARLWVDEIIDPSETRNYISMSIEAANHAPITKAFNVGIIQT